MKDFIINFPEEFESKDSKWRVDTLGLCWKDKVPVFKDKNEYKACDANMSFDGDGIHAEIEDDDFDRIGQPEKLTCGVNPIHTRRVDGHITVLNGEILELYYDDSMSILGEEEKINRLVQNGWNINRAVDGESKKPAVKNFAENLSATAHAASMSLKDINETPHAKSPQDSIVEVCDSIKELLLEKNRKYGNSALNPCRVFSKADSVEQLKVRIDDKINRIKNEQNDEDEDVVKDLIGYLVLLIIAKGNAQNDEP